MTTISNASWIPDLADPETFRAGVPYAAWDHMRSMPGLAWQHADAGTLHDGFFVVTRYDEALEVLQDSDRFSSSFGAVYPLPNPTRAEPLNKHILFMDPPEHSPVRRTATKSFGPRVVANFDAWIRECVVEALDNALPLGRFDWIENVCHLIPPLVIARILGVPPEERQYIVDASRDIFVAQSAKDGGASLGAELAKVGDYLARLGQEKLKNPADDMSTVLAQSFDAGEIGHVEYQMYLASILNAGAETTDTAMAHMGHLLASDPEVAAAARQALDEGKVDALVDEFLRFSPPAMNFARVAKRDTELNGQAIREGDMLVVSLAAANRDPAAFPRPNTFDPFRTDPKPATSVGGSGLTFSAGVHRCPGHHLAKLELRILLEELHARGVVLTMDGEAVRGASGVVNQLLALPVTATTD